MLQEDEYLYPHLREINFNEANPFTLKTKLIKSLFEYTI